MLAVDSARPEGTRHVGHLHQLRPGRSRPCPAAGERARVARLVGLVGPPHRCRPDLRSDHRAGARVGQERGGALVEGLDRVGMDEERGHRGGGTERPRARAPGRRSHPAGVSPQADRKPDRLGWGRLARGIPGVVRRHCRKDRGAVSYHADSRSSAAASSSSVADCVRMADLDRRGCRCRRRDYCRRALVDGRRRRSARSCRATRRDNKAGSGDYRCGWTGRCDADHWHRTAAGCERHRQSGAHQAGRRPQAHTGTERGLLFPAVFAGRRRENHSGHASVWRWRTRTC